MVELLTKQLVSDIQKTESKVYTVPDIQVSFSLELVPSDIKFTAFLDGELSNAATYFSSFANVSHSDITSLSAKFGISSTFK